MPTSGTLSEVQLTLSHFQKTSTFDSPLPCGFIWASGSPIKKRRRHLASLFIDTNFGKFLHPELKLETHCKVLRHISDKTLLWKMASSKFPDLCWFWQRIWNNWNQIWLWSALDHWNIFAFRLPLPCGFILASSPIIFEPRTIEQTGFLSRANVIKPNLPWAQSNRRAFGFWPSTKCGEVIRSLTIR